MRVLVACADGDVVKGMMPTVRFTEAGAGMLAFSVSRERFKALLMQARVSGHDPVKLLKW